MSRRISIFLSVLILCLPIGCNAPVHPQPTSVKQDPWPQGTVLVSRNRSERDNRSPGYWNHLAIYVGNYEIVESQVEVGVQMITTKMYNDRDYIWKPLFPKSLKDGKVAAAKARTLVGLPYRGTSSVDIEDRSPGRGLNCVSTVRLSWATAIGRNLPTLHKPDDIIELNGLFTERSPYTK